MDEMQKSMDSLSFIADLVKSLSWPVSAVIIVVLLRSRIEGAIERIRSIKHGKTLLSFSESLTDAQATAEDASITVVRPPSSFSRHIALAATPKSRIAESWRLVEDALREKARATGVEWKRAVPTAKVLETQGKLSNEIRDILISLDDAKEKAMKYTVEITDDEANTYAGLSTSITERIKNHP